MGEKVLTTEEHWDIASESIDLSIKLLKRWTGKNLVKFDTVVALLEDIKQNGYHYILQKSTVRPFTTESLSAPRSEPANQRTLSNKSLKIEPSMNRQIQYIGPNGTIAASSVMANLKGARDKEVADMEQLKSTVAWSLPDANQEVAKDGGANWTIEQHQPSLMLMRITRKPVRTEFTGPRVFNPVWDLDDDEGVTALP